MNFVNTSLLLFFTLAPATIVATPNFSNWHPPSSTDLRSPCPGLNSLANHGIIPRDGRNLTVPLLVERLGAALLLSPETAMTVSLDGMRTSSDPASKSFTLDDLNKHNIIEHDGSLSRQDHNLGGTRQFDPEVFKETLGYFDGKEEVGIEDLARVRWGRIQTSKNLNEEFVYGPSQRMSSYLESAILHGVFKDAKSGKAKVNWIDVFFREERLPFAEGWRPVNKMDGFSLIQGVLGLAWNTDEKASGFSGTVLEENVSQLSERVEL
ncbi:hypothetical protein N0V94_000336 [Neodidymelliopsis sp. IMI 364377]|nr:hypothetical protein N0V94_000336 [Neodidymelliopsis sp. IMI 364377]